MTCIDVVVPLDGLTTAELLLVTRWAHAHHAELGYNADEEALTWVIDLDALRGAKQALDEDPEPEPVPTVVPDPEPPQDDEPEPDPKPPAEPPAPKIAPKKPASNPNATDTTTTIRAWFNQHHQWAGTIRDFAARIAPDDVDRTIVATRNLVTRGRLTPIREGNRIVGLQHPDHTKPIVEAKRPRTAPRPTATPNPPARPARTTTQTDRFDARRARAAAAAYGDNSTFS